MKIVLKFRGGVLGVIEKPCGKSDLIEFISQIFRAKVWKDIDS
jgi:hypothetical protein